MPIVSVEREVAQGVVDALNLQTFSQEFEAVRAWEVRDTIESTENAIVSVIPSEDIITTASRGADNHAVGIDVVIQKQHSGTNEAAFMSEDDEIDDLAQEVMDYLSDPDNRIITESLNATPVAISKERDRDRLISDGVFTVMVSVTYSLVR